MIKPSVLIIEHDEENLSLVSDALKDCGCENIYAQRDSRLVMQFLNEIPHVDLIFLGLDMPYLRGQNLLAHLASSFPTLPVIIMTTYEHIETAAACTRQGAFYYIVKPLNPQAIASVTQRALSAMSPKPIRRIESDSQTEVPREEIKNPEAFSEIITKSQTMSRIFMSIENIAVTEHPILITGETGVGKELAAETIHKVSKRKGRFVPVNVAGLDENMFSDTLFGHRRGAFTGAMSDRKGLVESAAEGTLFLDEIGDLPMGSQVKLLRLLQQKEYYPLGADRTTKSNARILTATNQNLEDAVKEGRFRSDLYYRLRTHSIHLTPLRERKEDIPLLLRHFVQKYCNMYERSVPYIPTELDVLLRNYHFPGNIREFESMVTNAMTHSQGTTLSLQTFKDYIFNNPESSDKIEKGVDIRGNRKKVRFGETLPTLKEVSWLLIQEAMHRADNNQSIAAQMLGISQQALSKRLRGAETSENTDIFKIETKNS